VMRSNQDLYLQSQLSPYNLFGLKPKLVL